MKPYCGPDGSYKKARNNPIRCEPSAKFPRALRKMDGMPSFL